MAEKRTDQPKWASEEQPIYKQDSEDGMSDETLQDMDFSQKSSAMSKCQNALKEFAITLLPSLILRLSERMSIGELFDTEQCIHES
jgi:hypothetical protein